MNTASYNYILKVVQETNILPVTSACTSGCIFCSHKNNPPGLNVFALPKLTIEEIDNITEFLDGSRKIVIGESASRIIEGEPFLREDIIDILKLIRRKYPDTEIELTTSGTYLTEEIVYELEKLQPIELNISLNSSSAFGRKLLHREKNIMKAVEAVEHLKSSTVAFHGSIVAMPNIVGYEDIKETISFLSSCEAKTIRVFVPGFSGISENKIDFYETRERLLTIAEYMYELYGVPVFVEPPLIKDLKPEVIGTIKDSPANKHGILKGDVIVKVDDYAPLTRVDAYKALVKHKNPVVLLEREGFLTSLTLNKEAGISPGAVFLYDMDLGVIADINREVNKANAKKPLIVTSELGYNVLKLGIEMLPNCEMDILKVCNKFFGGTIKCAGLLTVEDIVCSLQSCLKEMKHDLIIIPGIPFDINGMDLSGHYYYEIEESVKIKTVVIV